MKNKSKKQIKKNSNNKIMKKTIRVYPTHSNFYKCFVKAAILVLVFISSLTSVKAQYSDYWLVIGNALGDDQCSTAQLGTSNKCPLRLVTDNKLRMIIKETGEIGIGLETPSNMVHIHSSNSSNARDLRVEELYQLRPPFEWREPIKFTKSGEKGTNDEEKSTNNDAKGFSTTNFDRFFPSESSILLTNANSGFTASDGLKIISNNNDATFHLQESGNMTFKNTSGTSMVLSSSGDFYVDNSIRLVTIQANGNMGIGMLPGTHRLSVSGDSYFTGYVGIGTIKPTQKFQVSGGNAHFEGNVYVNNRIGINTVSPQCELDVRGTAHFCKAVIKQSGWCDFVFEPDYKLPTLFEVDEYIKKHKHLPGIPSASEVEENGVDIGTMNVLLLQQLEEQVIHNINQQKDIENLKSELEMLREEFENLKRDLKK